MEKIYANEDEMLKDNFPGGYQITDQSNDLYNCAGFVCNKLLPEIYTTMDSFSPSDAIRENGGHFSLISEHKLEDFDNNPPVLKNNQVVAFTGKSDKSEIYHVALFNSEADPNMPFESKLSGGNTPRVRNGSIYDLINMVQKVSDGKLTHIQIFEVKKP